jgi:cytochrome oxidase Cu insertion factor (SCO1/SenC/PrrC family)
MARFFRMTLFLLIGLGLGLGIKYYMERQELNSGVIELSPDENGVATILKKPEKAENEIAGMTDIGGAFTLVDHNGNTVTEKDYADTYKLVFFGFTFCPAVCPTELQKLAVIMDSLGDDAEKVTPLFITVDPERDTPDVMKAYVEQFHPDLVGLTGNEEQVKAVTHAFKAYASKVEVEMMDEYMMDHSSFLYLTDHNNMVIDMYPAKDTAEDIAKEIQEKGL